VPVSVIDPTAALVVVDLQEGLREVPTVHPLPGVVANSAALAERFRARGLPVVLVTAAGRAPGRTDLARAGGGALPDGFAELMPELGSAPGDVQVVKHRWGAFLGTDLDEVLRGRGVTQVVVTGVATSAGVESTARSAYDLGYDVVLVTDAMSDRDPDAHEGSVRRVFPKLGETGTTAEVLALLAP
jgi:nicotinamidase-related amidase